MGGAVRSVVGAPVKVMQDIGLAPKPEQARQMIAEAKAAETPTSKASRAEEESGARMRGARRRGRQLLSDARLNAEAGVETLGSSQNL